MKKYPFLAREGWERMGVALLISIVATFTIGWWSLIFWLVFIFMLQFFRDPPRNISTNANDIVSPASGKVIKVETAQDPYLDRDALRISVFMNVFSVHSNLIPIAGKIKQRWYIQGKYFNAAVDKASTDNERNALCVETEDGFNVVFVQIAGLIARRILCYVKEGDEIDTGDRYGFIRFGSRVDLYLPLESEIKVQLGQWVDSGNHVLATLPNK